MNDALAEMKATHAPGLVLVLPDDPALREPFREQIDALLWSRRENSTPWLAATVVMVAEPEAAQARPGESLVMLDERGVRIAGIAGERDAKSLSGDATSLLKSQGRLEERARLTHLEPRELALLREASPLAIPLLTERLRELAPLLLVEEQQAPPDLARNIDGILALAIENRLQRDLQAMGPRSELPYGTRRDPERQFTPCSTCGMFAIPGGLAFLEEDPR